MKTRIIPRWPRLPLILLLCCLVAGSALAAGEQLNIGSFTGGGGAIEANGIKLYSSIGQPTSSLSKAGSIQLCTGVLCGPGVASTTPETPISGLTANNSGPTAPGNAVTFQATINEGSNVTYSWDFGDGGTGAGKTVSHVYNTPGTYTAHVTAINNTSTVMAETTVTISEPSSEDALISGLVAGNSGPTAPGNSVNFVATVDAGSNIAYTWDYGDGSSGSGATTSHVYANPGVYTARVTATNSVSILSTETTVTISQPSSEDAPIGSLTAVNSGPTTPGNVVNFIATVGMGSNISYTWDYGDGSSGSGASTSHVYTTPGVYTARVTATNNVSTLSAETTVTISEPPAEDALIFGLRATNSGPTPAGDVVTFIATVLGGSNVSYTWDFGDGSSGMGATATHTYAVPGTYLIQVIATNSRGSMEATTTVVVNESETPGGTDQPIRIYLPMIENGNVNTSNETVTVATTESGLMGNLENQIFVPNVQR